MTGTMDCTAPIDYSAPGLLTDLTAVAATAAGARALAGIPQQAAEICWPVHSLIIQPGEAKDLGWPEGRLAENQIRSVAGLVEALLALDPAPLDVPRPPERRVIGTCRHFAVLRMRASYQGQTGIEYDELLDLIAETCAADDPAALAQLYAREELGVPPGLIR